MSFIIILPDHILRVFLADKIIDVICQTILLKLDLNLPIHFVSINVLVRGDKIVFDLLNFEFHQRILELKESTMTNANSIHVLKSNRIFYFLVHGLSRGEVALRGSSFAKFLSIHKGVLVAFIACNLQIDETLVIQLERAVVVLNTGTSKHNSWSRRAASTTNSHWSVEQSSQRVVQFT